MPAAADSEVYRALADATRRRVLEALVRGPMPVRRIAEAFPVSRPAISKHLRLLRDAGLVSEERRGRERIYRLQTQPLGEVQGWIDRLSGAAASARPGKRRAWSRRAQGQGELASEENWRVW